MNPIQQDKQLALYNNTDISNQFRGESITIANPPGYSTGVIPYFSDISYQLQGDPINIANQLQGESITIANTREISTGLIPYVNDTNYFLNDPVIIGMLSNGIDFINASESICDKAKGIKQIFDLTELENNSVKNQILAILSSANGLKGIQIENLRDFKSLKLTFNEIPYVFEELPATVYQNKGIIDVISQKNIPSGAPEILYWFPEIDKSLFGGPILQQVWYLSRFYEIDLENDIIKNGDIEILKTLATDVLEGLQFLHNNGMSYKVNKNNIRGTKINGVSTFSMADITGIAPFDGWLFSNWKYVLADIKHFGDLLIFLDNQMSVLKNDNPARITTANGERFNLQTNDNMLIDLIMICHGHTENQPRDITDLLNHPFFTGKHLNYKNGWFGARNYMISRDFE